MNALSRFEELVERVIEGTLVRPLVGSVQPVEIANRLARAMEDGREVAKKRGLAPNDYVVQLNPEDFEHFAPAQRSFERELESFIRDAAAERGLVFLNRPAVHLVALDSVSRRRVRVVARMADAAGSAEPDLPSLDLTQRFAAVLPPPTEQAAGLADAPAEVRYYLAPAGGARYLLARSVVTLGRALDNNIVIEDTQVSRYHAELRLSGAGYQLRDLRSTNGTRLNGQSVSESPLKPGDRLELGALMLTYLVERAAGGADAEREARGGG